MSQNNSNDKHDPEPDESEFDVFRPDGATRLPNQQFPDSVFEATKRMHHRRSSNRCMKPICRTRLQHLKLAQPVNR